MLDGGGVKRALIYARVSTDEQRFNYSPETQIAACRQYAEAHGLEVVGEPLFDDYTGTVPIEARPAGRRAVELLEAGQADALVTFRMDRIARPPDDGDEWEIPGLIRRLAKLGREIHTVNRGQLGTSFAELLLAVLDARGAGEERRSLLERSKAAKRTKASRGQWVGTGAPPYGADRQGTRREVRLVPNTAELGVVQRIFREFTGDGGRERALKLAQVAGRLTREGVPTPRGYYQGARRGIWYPESLRRILRRRLYLGEWSFAGIPVAMPEFAVVDEGTWDLAQVLLRINADEARRNRKHRYLLAGHFKCTCGRAMSGGQGHGEADKYRCSARKADPRRTTCRETPVLLGLADQVVWGWLEGLLASAEALEAGLAEAAARRAAGEVLQRQRLEALAGEIEQAERRVRRLGTLFADTPAGPAAEVLRREVLDLAAERERLEGERGRLEAELARAEIPEIERRALRALAAEVREELQAPSFDLQRELLGALDLQALLRVDDAGRWLDVTCAIAPGDLAPGAPVRTALRFLSSARCIAGRPRLVVFAAALRLDGARATAEELAEELFAPAEANHARHT